jgi:oligoribonuclease
MLLWLDLETTGLDPERDVVLEVGAILTDDELNEVARFHEVLYTPLELQHLDPYIQEMHTKNGLWYEVKGEAAEERWYVEHLLEEWLRTHSGVGAQLAGSSIHFDREFLRHSFPRVLKLLHHRQVDVSTLNEMARRVWPELYATRPPKAEAHRVMADIDESMRVYRHYQASLAPIVAKEPETRAPGPMLTDAEYEALMGLS